MAKTCQASAMDAAFFENWDDPVTPCDEPAAIVVLEHELCLGCAEALARLASLGDELIDDGDRVYD